MGLPKICWLMVGVFVVIWALLLPSVLRDSVEKTFSDDAQAYHQEGIHLSQSGFFSSDGAHANTEHEPGYGAFLAVTYRLFGEGNRVAIFVVQALLYIGAALFFLLEFAHITSKRAATIESVFLFLSPAVFSMAFTVYRELVVLSLLLLFAAAFLRWVRTRSWTMALLSGVAFGSVILTYFSFVFFPLVLIPYELYLRLPKAHIATMFVIIVVMTGGWLLRNASIRDPYACVIPGCSRSSGAWITRARQVRELHGFEPLHCLWVEYITHQWDTRDPACAFGVPLSEFPHGLTEPEKQQLGKQALQQVLRSFPAHMWISSFWLLEYQLPLLNGWGKTYNKLETLMTAIVYLGMVLCLFRVRWKKEYIIFVLLIAYGSLLFSLIDVVPRYRMPILFAYSSLAALGYATLFESKTEKKLEV